MGVSSPGGRAPRLFGARLPIPEVLTGADLTIRMREAAVSVLPGSRTRMWTYGGSFPGPTIRRPAGETTRVRFVHELGRKAGELTVHLHGGHNRATEDGQPGGLTALQSRALYCDLSAGLSASESGNELLIRPGRGRTYTYEQMEDGEPERASFQFYHDHRLENTARNIWRGLVGMWIVDDELDSSLPLPKGPRDIPQYAEAQQRHRVAVGESAKLSRGDGGRTGHRRSGSLRPSCSRRPLRLPAPGTEAVDDAISQGRF